MRVDLNLPPFSPYPGPSVAEVTYHALIPEGLHWRLHIGVCLWACAGLVCLFLLFDGFESEPKSSR